MDYYEVLGVNKQASASELKAAYRKKALEWHPDRNKAEGATDKFKEINKAYEVLSNPQKKQMYDQYGKDAFERGGFGKSTGGAAPGGYSQQGPFSYTYSSGGSNPFEGFDMGGFSDPFDIFEQFFGFNNQGGRTRAKRHEIYQIELTFEEAVNGVEKETVIKGKQKRIKIPAGVDDNMRIRFSDFDVLVRVRPHKNFKREGQDIYIEYELSYTKAVLGGVVTIKTVNDEVELRVRPGTQSGTTVRLRGQGIVYPNTSRRGDAYVIYRIQVPEHITLKARKLLDELDKEL
jgi:molecular chaperone DnaJ